MLSSPSVPTFAKWPFYDADEVAAGTACLTSGKVNYWTGTEGREFEKEFAQWCGAKHAIVLGNGTLALELAHKALKLQPGDEVITTPRTFVASATAFAIWGIKPIFADVDLDSGNITAESIERVITPRTKAILPVHLGGWPADMPAILALAEARGIHVIEDCAQAHGAAIDGRSVGTFGIVNAWSFCQDKIITTAGEGGMVTTDDEDLWKSMWAFKDHGKNYDAVYNREHPIGFRWLHEGLGTNWRLPEIQSAVGRIQLQKLAGWTRARSERAELLNKLFQDNPVVRVPVVPDNITHAWYRWYGYLNTEMLSRTREEIMAEVNKAGVPLTIGSCGEIYREKGMIDAGFAPEKPLPNAHQLHQSSFAFLVHPTLSLDAVQYGAEVLIDVLKRSLR